MTAPTISAIERDTNVTISDDNECCARCQRPAPDEDDQSLVALEWETLVNSDGDVTGVVCPDCITPEEQQATDEADMAIHDQVAGLAGHCARCLKAVPYVDDDPGAPLPGGWAMLNHDDPVMLIVCPDCICPGDELMDLREKHD